MAPKRSATTAYRPRRFAKRRFVANVKRVVTSLAEKKFSSGALALAYTSPTSWTIQSALAGTTVGTGGGPYGISQGSGVGNRTGNRIRLTKIEFQVTVVPQPGTVNIAGEMCRMILYHNKQANGAAITPTELFDTDAINSLRNENERPRVTILKDMLHHMQPTSSASAQTVTSTGYTTFKWTIYPKTVVQYSDGFAAITSVLTNDYGIGVISTRSGCCQIAVGAKVFYTDD